MDDARTEADPEPPPAMEGEASPPPLLFTLVIWSGAFSVVLWSMLMLFGNRGFRQSRPPEPEPDEPT